MLSNGKALQGCTGVRFEASSAMVRGIASVGLPTDSTIVGGTTTVQVHGVVLVPVTSIMRCMALCVHRRGMQFSVTPALCIAAHKVTVSNGTPVFVRR